MDPSGCVFFFSSRRRHTRYWRDWSSDVCSSDLGQLGLAEGVTVSGDSIDFIHCAKALKFRLEEDITLWLKATPKPTFYDTSSLKATILKRTGQFEAMGALAEGKTNVRLIDVADIPANDILKGIYTGVKVTCYYTYGIKEIEMDLFFAV